MKIIEMLFSKTFFIGAVIVTLSGLYGQAINEKNKLKQSLNEVKTMDFNTRLEFIDFVENRKKEIALKNNNGNTELSENDIKEAHNKFRRVGYSFEPNGTNKVIEVNFSELQISCETYFKILSQEKKVFADAKFVNVNCDSK